MGAFDNTPERNNANRIDWIPLSNKGPQRTSEFRPFIWENIKFITSSEDEKKSPYKSYAPINPDTKKSF